jgi:hypothetical protein
MMTWSRVIDVIRRGEAESGRLVVSRMRRRLRPGLFIYSKGTLWRHWRQPIAEHVRVTKGSKRRPRPASASHEVPDIRVRLRTALRYLLDLLSRRFIWVAPHDGHHRFPLAIAASDGGCVLIDPGVGWVARTFGSGDVGRVQLEMRMRWSAHVPSPAFETEEDGRLILERYIPGEHISSIAPDRQVGLVRDVYRSYTDLVRSEGEGSSRRLLEQLLHPRILEHLPDVLRQHLHRDDLLQESEAWPLVPTARSCDERNVIVAGDHTAVFIDSIPLDLQPFFSIPVGVVTSWSRTAPQLKQVYLGGGFDDDLEALFTAAGARFERTPACRRLLIAVSLLVRAHVFVLTMGRTEPEDLIREAETRIEAYGLDRSGSWHTT